MDQLRTYAVFRKELIHIKRDPSSLIQIVLMPITLLLLYGFALTFDIRNVPLAVMDRDGTQVSRDFVQRFAGSRYFRLSHKVESYDQAYNLLDTGRARLALVVPHDFSRDIKEGGETKVQVILDGADANTANIVLGYVQAIVSGYNQEVMVERMRPRGVIKMKPPLNPEPRVWYNEELESRNFIVPGLVVVIMTMVGALLTSLCVVREAERGSMEGLMASPLLRSELILGKLGPYFIIGMVDMAIAMGMGQWLFEVPMRGSWLLMIAASALYLLVMLGQGLLISVAAGNQLQANQMAMLTTFLPALLLSGFMFDVRQMPMALQVFSYIVPAKYFVKITKDIYLKGLGFHYFLKDALFLIGFAALFLALAVRRFRKKVR